MSELRLPAVRRGALLRSIRRLPLGFRMLAIAVVAIVAIVFPAFEGSDSFVMYTATQALVYGLAIVSLNLLVGFGGQISLGHAGFLAIGGYTAALLAIHVSGLPVPIEVLGAGAATAAFAAAGLTISYAPKDPTRARATAGAIIRCFSFAIVIVLLSPIN